jgi:hypothetical protein
MLITSGPSNLVASCRFRVVKRTKPHLLCGMYVLSAGDEPSDVVHIFIPSALYEFFNIWNRFVKPLASDSQIGPLIIFFSSFRSAAGELDAPGTGSAPVRLRLDQRVSIQQLPYTISCISIMKSLKMLLTDFAPARGIILQPIRGTNINTTHMGIYERTPWCSNSYSPGSKEF